MTELPNGNPKRIATERRNGVEGAIKFDDDIERLELFSGTEEGTILFNGK